MGKLHEGKRVESRNERPNILEERSYQRVQPVTCVCLGPNWRLVRRGLHSSGVPLREIHSPISPDSLQETLAEWQMVWPWKRHSRSFVFLLCPVVSSTPFFTSRAHDTLVTNVSRRCLRIKNSRRCYNSISWRIATTHLAERICSHKFISLQFNGWSYKTVPLTLIKNSFNACMLS